MCLNHIKTNQHSQHQAHRNLSETLPSSYLHTSPNQPISTISTNSLQPFNPSTFTHLQTRQNPSYDLNPYIMSDSDASDERGFHHADQDDSQLEGSDVFDESDVNFDDIPAYAHLPPQDPWRKVKRELMKNLNLCRQEGDPNATVLEQEWLLSENLQEYVKLVLEDDEDEQQLQNILSQTKAIGVYKHCTAVTLLEEDSGDINHLIEPFLDAQGLLLETHRDLLLGNFNHVAIGLGVQGKRLVLVLAFTLKELNITKIDKNPDGIYIEGKMLNPEFGVYVMRIVEITSMKEKKIVGPQHLAYDMSTLVFAGNIPYAEGIEYGPEGKGKNFLEIYIRNNPDKILYGLETDEKLTTKYLKPAERMRIEIYPDPRQKFEEAKHEERKMLLLQRQQEFEEEKKKEIEAATQAREQTRERQRKEIQDGRASDEFVRSSSSAQRSKVDKSSSSNMTPKPDSSADEINQASDDESHSSFNDSENDENMGTAQEIKESTIQAIEECLKEQSDLRSKNQELERRVINIRTKIGNIAEKSTEENITDGKYKSTLLNVHQVQQKMEELQTTYNNWAKVYEENIVEKQERCKEIQDYFREFKREVAKGAEFARNGKKIKQKVIDEWEENETKRDELLQEVRIQNITLKNKLKKLEEKSKEKEKLAEGLHLIDYEQLKIENQTLNEKIEERNEELHKLKKKIETTVQILTHTKEKLQFVRKEKEVKEKQKDDLAKTLELQRKNLHESKDLQERARASYIKSKQETGIINSKELDQDLSYKKRRVVELKDELRQMEDQYLQMQVTIGKAKALTKK